MPLRGEWNELAGRRRKLEMLRRIIDDRIDQERTTSSVQWELIPFLVAVAVAAGEEVVGPLISIVGERCLRAKVVDVRALAVLAVHASFETSRHFTQNASDLIKRFVLLQGPKLRCSHSRFGG